MRWLGSLGQRVVASDPGGRRLRGALQVLLGIAFGAGGALGLFALLDLPLTAVAPAVATVMLSLLAVRTGGVGERLLTMGLMPVAATAGIALAVAAGALGGTLTGEVVFLAVIVVAVILRRFGPRATALGMIGFMGYFLALFVQASPDMILPMGLASLCGAGGAMLSKFVLLREPPHDTWRRAVESLIARVGTLRAEVDAYDGSARIPRKNWRVGSELMRLNDAAVGMGNGFQYLDDLPQEEADEVRGRVLDVDLAATELVAALRVGGDDPPGTVRYQRAERALEDAAQALRTEPSEGSQEPADSSTGRGEQHAGDADHDRDAHDAGDADQEGGAERPDKDDDDGAKSGADKGGISENSRTAIQALLAAVLAMVVGNLVSPSQWFWAVVTSFVVFAGTASRGELAVKAWGRTIGTLGGVIAGVIVAALLDGLLPLQIITAVACIFLAIYLQPLSFTLMTFFVTTLLGVVYSLLGTFSTEVLVLRLVETAIGAAAGILAGAMVLPTRTRDVVRENTASLLEDLAAFLGDTATTVRGEPLEDDASLSVDDVDASLQDLLTSAEPVGAVRFGDSRLRFQHWRSLVWWLGASARRLARVVNAETSGGDTAGGDARPGKDEPAGGAPAGSTSPENDTSKVADLVDAVAAVASAAADADYSRARELATVAEGIDVDAPEEIVSLLGAIRAALVDLADLLAPEPAAASDSARNTDSE